MTVAAQCECGGEAVFHIDGIEANPVAECDGCERKYELTINRVIE